MTDNTEVLHISREPDSEELKLLGADTENGLIHRILSQLGLSLKDTKRATTGNNTTTYILTCHPRPQAPKQHIEMKYAGTDPIPIGGGEVKIVFSTSKIQEDMNAVLMVENRVAAMRLARDGGMRNVPRVYGWSDGKGEGEIQGQTWCLMEYMRGTSI